MITKIIKSIIVIIISLQLCSCFLGKKDDLASICKSDPELCADTHKIGDCRFLRTNVIRARFYDKLEPSDLHTESLLNELTEYESCLELTLLLQFTKLRERKQKRLENYLQTQALIKEILDKSRNTQDPHLAYYLWTNYQDLDAKKVFLNATKNKEIKDIKLLIKLATIASKNKPQKSLDLFYNALSLSKSIDELPESTFTLIMTLFYQSKNYEQAYIWAVIAKEIDTEENYPINLDLILQKGLTNGPKLINNEEELEEEATLYLKNLKKGKFSVEAPNIKKTSDEKSNLNTY